MNDFGLGSAGTEVAFASCMDERHPPENIVDGCIPAPPLAFSLLWHLAIFVFGVQSAVGSWRDCIDPAVLPCIFTIMCCCVFVLTSLESHLVPCPCFVRSDRTFWVTTGLYVPSSVFCVLLLHPASVRVPHCVCFCAVSVKSWVYTHSCPCQQAIMHVDHVNPRASETAS